MYTEHPQPFVEGVSVAGHDLLPRDVLLVGLVDDLVFYVRDVLDERHFVVPAPQVPDHHVPEQGRPRVADVYVVVDGGTADVEPDPAILADLDRSSAQAVPYQHAHTPSLASRARTIRLRATSAPSTAKR